MGGAPMQKERARMPPDGVGGVRRARVRDPLVCLLPIALEIDGSCLQSSSGVSCECECEGSESE